MRILVCTKRDLHGAHFLNRLLPRLAGHELAGIWLSEKTSAPKLRLTLLGQAASTAR